METTVTALTDILITLIVALHSRKGDGQGERPTTKLEQWKGMNKHG